MFERLFFVELWGIGGRSNSGVLWIFKTVGDQVQGYIRSYDQSELILRFFMEFVSGCSRGTVATSPLLNALI